MNYKVIENGPSIAEVQEFGHAIDLLFQRGFTRDQVAGLLVRTLPFQQAPLDYQQITLALVLREPDIWDYDEKQYNALIVRLLADDPSGTVQNGTVN
jgi:hypothetical protein